jgi:hypothetical protein
VGTIWHDGMGWQRPEPPEEPEEPEEPDDDQEGR